MKNQLLLLSLAAAALLAGCSKNEPDTPANTPATEISAKAVGAGSIDTKAPISGSTFDGRQADVYTTVSPLHTYTGDKTRMFTDAYTRGTMTFDDVQYVGYDPGFKGNSLLPQDGTVRYLTAFHPVGWTRAADAMNTFETLSFTFDGSHDVMTSWMTGDLDVQVKHNDATLPERGDFTFKHLLMRCDVQVQAKDANAVTDWGHVKSVKIKGTVNNTVTTDASLGYNYSTGSGAVSFFEMGGTDAARTYTDAAFEQAALADMLPLSVDVQNACYAMLAPVDVDADPKTAELTLVVVTRDKADADGGKEVTTEVPISLDQAKFINPAGNTRGYAVTVQLNFRAGAIKALASVEKWKDGGSQNEDIDGTEPASPKIGDLKNGGIVYWIDPADAKKYKVVSVTGWSGKKWAAKQTYVIGSGAQSDTNGKGNAAAIKAAFDSGTAGIAITESTFEAAFPAAAECYNYQGKDDNDAKGTWYLPAKSELQYLWCAYNGKAPISWASDVNASAPIDTAAQTVFNQYLIDAGGSVFPASGYFWAGTESSGYARYAWCVEFSNGTTAGYDKSFSWYVRCVRDL